MTKGKNRFKTGEADAPLDYLLALHLAEAPALGPNHTFVLLLAAWKGGNNLVALSLKPQNSQGGASPRQPHRQSHSQSSIAKSKNCNHNMLSRIITCR